MRYAGLLIATTVVVSACGGELSGTDIKACTTATAYGMGTTVTGTVDANDCKDPTGEVGDVYSFTAISPNSFTVTFSGNGFKPGVRIWQGMITGTSNKLVADVDQSDATSFKVYTPSGTYYILVTSENASGGNYTFSTTSPAAADGCNPPLIYTIKGVTLSGTITPQDCAGGGTEKFDAYQFYLQSGETVNVSGNINKGATFALRAGDASTPNLVTRAITVPTGGTTSFSYTAPSTGLYRVHVNTDPQFGTATYGMTIN